MKMCRVPEEREGVFLNHIVSGFSVASKVT